jgi:hypothetical protein
MADGALREQLVLQYGFSIHRVQPSKDRRTVFILWDASPGKAQVGVWGCVWGVQTGRCVLVDTWSQGRKTAHMCVQAGT